MKIFICSNDNQLIAAKVCKHSIIKRSKYLDKDIQIVKESEISALSYFHSKPYLRQGRMIKSNKHDMQSFTLLRFFIPELMGYQGKALVLDPDIFLVRNGLEELEDFKFNSVSIYARRGLKKNAWGSSVLLIDCSQLKHWSLQKIIDGLHKGKIDYDELMGLKLERLVGELETRWNEFDIIKKNTVLLHLTERITQPWRTGLKLNSSIKPILRFIPRAPIYKIFGKDLTKGREHPSKDVRDFFFTELSDCISKKLISTNELDAGIQNKFIRDDIKEKLNAGSF